MFPDFTETSWWATRGLRNLRSISSLWKIKTILVESFNGYKYTEPKRNFKLTDLELVGAFLSDTQFVERFVNKEVASSKIVLAALIDLSNSIFQFLAGYYHASLEFQHKRWSATEKVFDISMKRS